MSSTAEATAPSGSERRQSVRHELEVEVGFESDHNFYTGLTQDISTGGLFVATHQIKRVGEHIKIKFTIPGHKDAIEVETEVRWVRESSSLRRADGAHGMGLKFINLAPETQKILNAFLEKRDSLFFDDE